MFRGEKTNLPHMNLKEGFSDQGPGPRGKTTFWSFKINKGAPGMQTFSIPSSQSTQGAKTCCVFYTIFPFLPSNEIDAFYGKLSRRNNVLHKSLPRCFASRSHRRGLSAQMSTGSKCWMGQTGRPTVCYALGDQSTTRMGVRAAEKPS